MSEVDELGQTLGRTGAALLSTALVLAGEAMRRRQERAERAAREGEQRQRDYARQLNAERELAAVQWRRVNLQQWFRESPREVADVWASAAAWAPHDDRAREALDSLNTMLDRYGVMAGEVAQTAQETGNYEALSTLLAQGAEEARRRAEQAAHVRAETNQTEQTAPADNGTAPNSTGATEPGTAGMGGPASPGEQGTGPTPTVRPPRKVDYEILVTSRGGEPRVWLTGPGTVAEAVAQLRLAAELREHVTDPTTLLEYRVTLTPHDDSQAPFALNGAGLSPQVASALRSIAAQVGTDYGEPGQDYTDPAPTHPTAEHQARTQPRAQPGTHPQASAATQLETNPANAAADSARLHCQIIITPHNAEPPSVYGGCANVEEISRWLQWTAAHTEQGGMSAEPSTYTYDVRMSLDDGQAPASFVGDGDSTVIGEHLRWIGAWVQHETGYGQPSNDSGPSNSTPKEASHHLYGGAEAARVAGLSFAETSPAATDTTAARDVAWSHPVMNAVRAWRRKDLAGEQVGQIYRNAAAAANLAGKGFSALTTSAAPDGAKHQRQPRRSGVLTATGNPDIAPARTRAGDRTARLVGHRMSAHE